MPSTAIRGFACDAERRRLDIAFTTGRLYCDFDVRPGVAADMRTAFAKGEYFNAHIRARYRTERLDEGEPDLFSVRKVNE